MLLRGHQRHLKRPNRLEIVLHGDVVELRATDASKRSTRDFHGVVEGFKGIDGLGGGRRVLRRPLHLAAAAGRPIPRSLLDERDDLDPGDVAVAVGVGLGEEAPVAVAGRRFLLGDSSILVGIGAHHALRDHLRVSAAASTACTGAFSAGVLARGLLTGGVTTPAGSVALAILGRCGAREQEGEQTNGGEGADRHRELQRRDGYWEMCEC